MLGVYDYPTKKDLKAAIGQRLKYIETSLFNLEFKPNGDSTVVGPDAYNARNWYATVTCKDGVIIKVK